MYGMCTKMECSMGVHESVSSRKQMLSKATHTHINGNQLPCHQIMYIEKYTEMIRDDISSINAIIVLYVEWHNTEDNDVQIINPPMCQL
jgi:hypothetical protein